MDRRITTAGLLVLLSIGTMGAVPIDMCVEPSFEAAVAVVQLGEHSAAVRLRPVRPGRCDVGDGYRARLMQRGAGVALVLATPAGERLERAVPWIDRAEDGIVALARRGRLGGLAVLLDGLIIEDRALQAAIASPPIAAEPPVAPAPAVEIEAPPPPPPPPPPAPPVVLASAVRTGELPGPARAPVTRGREATRGAPRATPVSRVVDRERLDRDAALLARPPPPPEAAPFGDAPRLLARAPARPEVAPPIASGAPAGASPPPGSPWRPRIGTRVGGAMRAPTVLGLEVALALDVHGAVAEVGALPPLEWALEDRPLEIGAAWVGVGWAPRLWRGVAVHVDGRLMAVLERWTVRRLGIDDAVTRALWDAGGEIGLAVASPVGDGWRVGALLAGRWMATANEVLIPDGPRAALNTWQMRLGLAIDWRP